MKNYRRRRRTEDTDRHGETQRDVRQALKETQEINRDTTWNDLTCSARSREIKRDTT